VDVVPNEQINGSYPAFNQEIYNWTLNLSYTSFGAAEFYDNEDIECKNWHLFRCHVASFVQRKITTSIMHGSDWRNKQDLSFVDMLLGSAFNMMIWGTSLDIVLSSLFDIIRILQCVYCVWIFIR
jgi:hypothetical protein